MSDTETRTLGVIGGSGLYAIEGLERVTEHNVETPFGKPSDAIIEGWLGDTRLLFLPRHGRGHKVAPHEINYRANILALKMLGAEQLLSVSAVGSMKESIEPGHMVVVDQFIDRTRTRPSTFFEGHGLVAHVEFAEPVDAALADALYRSSVNVGARTHRGGTYICIEGPQFSTRAESNFYRSFGVDVIGMTNLPEARLAREAELPFATLALATDYDCWHTGHESVTVESVIEVIKANVSTAKKIVAEIATKLPDPKMSPATTALQHALMSPLDELTDEAKARFQPLIARFL